MKLTVLLIYCLVPTVCAQDGMTTCSTTSIQQDGDAVLKCHFPEDINVTKRDFSVYHYRKDANPDAVIDCLWMRNNLTCLENPGYKSNKKVDTQFTVTISRVNSSNTGSYACQIAGYKPSSFKTCQLDIEYNSHEDKITCSSSYVQTANHTVLTCNFPEDLSLTKKDFSLYHYNEGVNPEAVIDCMWKNGNLKCLENPGYNYSKTVDTQLRVTINLETSDTGTYVCQIAGYRPSSFGTCRPKNDGKVTCSVPPVKTFHDTVLTCHFPEDLSVSKKDFMVNHYVRTNDPEAVLDCWWIRGVVQCYTDPDFVYNKTVSRTLEITARNVTTALTGRYACQIADYDPSFLETCELSVKPVSEYFEDKISNHYMVMLTFSLLSVTFALVILVLGFRRKLLSRYCQQRRRQTPHDEHIKSDNKMMLEKQEVQAQKFQEYLEQTVREMYPDILNSFYFVPPIYFNKSRCKKETVASKSILVYESSNASDLNYDRAMQHVLHCLRHVGEQRQEQMFVLTQFHNEDYSNTVPKYYARHSVCSIRKDDEKNIKCFDLLIIHRKLGFIAAVVNTVSGSPVKEDSDQQTTDETFVAQFTEVILQLKKAGRMINYLMSDETQCPEVRLVLILPNLSSSSLAPHVTSQADQVQFICADDLPDSKSTFDVSTEQIQKLGQWWDLLMESTHGDTMMSDQLYVKAISRFCGPAFQSYLNKEDGLLLPKTLAETVLVTGKLYERHILHPHMLDLLKEERLILVGPPNTGKTRMLTLAAKKWRASELYVISGKRAQNNFVKQLGGHNIECDFNNQREVEETVKVICEKNEHKTLYVLAYNVSGQHLKTFCTPLKQKNANIWMWATARTMRESHVPNGWRLVTLTHALNCPPAVVRAASRVGYTIPGADNYLPPTDGPPVKYIYHKKDQGNLSHDCTKCGEEVAKFIKLLITSCGNSATTSPDGVSLATKTVSMENVSSILQEKDLLVLFECNLEQRESFLNGLINAGISVHNFMDKEDMNDFTKENESACAMHVGQLDRYRLRRKIVVYVESKSWNGELFTKWRGITSCTSQLIVVSKNFA